MVLECDHDRVWHSLSDLYRKLVHNVLDNVIVCCLSTISRICVDLFQINRTFITPWSFRSRIRADVIKYVNLFVNSFDLGNCLWFGPVVKYSQIVQIWKRFNQYSLPVVSFESLPSCGLRVFVNLIMWSTKY